MTTNSPKKAWIGLRRFFRDQSDELNDDIKNSWPIKLALVTLVVFLIAMIVLGIYWSREPDSFAVADVAREQVEAPGQRLVPGVVTTASLIHVAETLLEKPGGYLSNDIMPPGVWLDNMPNWEFGVLTQVRDLSRSMRQSFSRSQSQSREDEALAKAEPRFNFDNNSWALPASESEYRDGIAYLRAYLIRLSDDTPNNARFYARADNLRDYLSTVESRLGSLSQRLSASVGQRRLNTDLAGEPGAGASRSSDSASMVKTPRFEVDDIFYEARGSAWALLHFLKAVDQDFAPILESKNARVSLQQIIRELEATQQPLRSPIVLNGSGFGMFANHSLVMASYISRAHSALSDLRALLAQG